MFSFPPEKAVRVGWTGSGCVRLTRRLDDRQCGFRRWLRDRWEWHLGVRIRRHWICVLVGVVHGCIGVEARDWDLKWHGIGDGVCLAPTIPINASPKSRSPVPCPSECLNNTPVEVLRSTNRNDSVGICQAGENADPRWKPSARVPNVLCLYYLTRSSSRIAREQP